MELGWSFSGKKECEIELSEREQKIRVVGVGAGHVDSDFEISGLLDPPSGGVVSGTPDTMSSLLFHFPNVPDFEDSPNAFASRVEDGGFRCERVVLRSQEWVLTLDSLEDGDKVARNAAEIRGFAITRVGKLERANGKKFSLKKSREVLEIVGYLLSFALGRWCHPMLLVGYGRDGTRVCEVWSTPRTSPFQRHDGWFDFRHPGALSELFPRLCDLWRDDSLRDTLKDATYMLLEIQQQPISIDIGIVIGQVALEMLAWWVLVENDLPVVSEDGFDGLRAADKLRLLLSTCSIPFTPAIEFGHLPTSQKRSGPECAVAIRNSIVHRNKQKRDLYRKESPPLVLGTALQLVCWYLELVLLHQMGYASSYSNRLKNRRAGQVEPVPWALSSVTPKPGAAVD
jgi:hypothetical protein